jgi:hypothetical protein
LLALKEIEYLGHTCEGALAKRIANLVEFILGRIEARCSFDPSGLTVPERVKRLRNHVIRQLEELHSHDSSREQLEEDLEDLFLVVQAFSYPGDYVLEQASVERMAETLDKFEEDVLETPTATIRGARKATITLGEPVPVAANGDKKAEASRVTSLLEKQVQELLDKAQIGSSE